VSFQRNFHVETSVVLAKADWEYLCQLWNAVYPVEIEMASGEALQNMVESANCKHYTIRDQGATLEAWLAVFDRYDTRWFSIIVSPAAQGRGYGKALLAYAKTIEPILEGWVVQSESHLLITGENYKSPIAFYKKLGFRLNPNRFPTDDKLDVICMKWER